MAEPGMRQDPFALLGLPARAGLSDEDVRAAWRRIAAATHPDREDGGDPAVFGAAAAAYVMLRTSFGRGEALADLGGAAAAGSARRPGRHRRQRVPVRLLSGLARRGGPLGAGAGFAAGVAAGGRGRDLAMRTVVAGAASTVAFVAAGWSPGTAGVLAGALTWLLVAGRGH